MPDVFFDKRTKYSEIKSRIAVKYFRAWATMMIARSRSEKLIYIDLFSGPGKYRDGNYSTPVLIAKEIIKNEAWRDKILMIFNDKSEEAKNHLETEIRKLEGYDKIKNKPKFFNDDTADLQEYFSKNTIYPAFSFIDPYGYGALSQELIDGLVKDWGCDCLFFFNYSALRRAVSNKKANHNRLETIFGKGRVGELSSGLSKLKTSIERQKFMLKFLFNYSRTFSLNYFVPFTFVRKHLNRVHMLIFVSKKFTAYKIMKDIMWEESGKKSDDFTPFVYPRMNQGTLFPDMHKEDLSNKLLEDFHGEEDTFENIYKKSASIFGYFYYHKECYTKALKHLEGQKKVKIECSQTEFFDSRIADKTKITFLGDKNGD